MLWLVLLLAFAEPFWQEKPVAEWTDIQLSQFLGDSPWARVATTAGKAPAGTLPIVVYIASAEPVRKAEQERTRRAALRRKQPDDLLAEEYQVWLEENRPSRVVLALRTGALPAFSDGAELRRMEQDCWMRTARGRIKVIGYFPPTPRDPVLRLAFPRSTAGTEEKTLAFDLYLPGVSGPFREVQFPMKDLVWDGKPAY